MINDMINDTIIMNPLVFNTLYWTMYCLFLTVSIRCVYSNRYSNREMDFCETFSFVILSVLICNISPAIYILLISNVRF